MEETWAVLGSRARGDSLKTSPVFHQPLTRAHMGNRSGGRPPKVLGHPRERTGARQGRIPQ